jgi:hypothetical protein
VRVLAALVTLAGALETLMLQNRAFRY